MNLDKYKKIAEIEEKSKEKVKVPEKFKNAIDGVKEEVEDNGGSNKYSKSQLTEILKNEAKELGKTPTLRYFREKDSLPSPYHFKSTFGSWNKAIKAAGLEPNRPFGGGAPKKYTDEQLISLLKKEGKKREKTPSTIDFLESDSLPSPGVYQQRWGSWNEALKAAGFEPREKKWKSRRKRKKREKIEKSEKEGLSQLKAVRNISGDKISRKVNKLNLSGEVEEKSRELFQSLGRIMGYSEKNIKSACVYLATKICGCPIGLSYFLDDTEKKSKIHSAITKVEKELEINPCPPTTAYLEWAQKAINEKVEDKGKEIVTDEGVAKARDLIKKTNLQGVSPTSQAGAALYLIMSEENMNPRPTQSEVGDAVGISEVSVRSVKNRLLKHLDKTD